MICQTFSPEQNDFKNTSNIKSEQATYLKPHDTEKKKEKKYIESIKREREVYVKVNRSVTLKRFKVTTTKTQAAMKLG